jgi:hypothetical protein
MWQGRGRTDLAEGEHECGHVCVSGGVCEAAMGDRRVERVSVERVEQVTVDAEAVPCPTERAHGDDQHLLLRE